MRATGLGVLAGLLLAALAGSWVGRPASADNGPHKLGQSATTEACAGCHRAHSGKAAYLLKASEDQICLTCHDGSQATTNVKNGSSTTGGALRAGGFEQAWLDTKDPSYTDGDIIGPPGTVDVTVGVRTSAQPVLSSHSTNGSAQTVWGNGPNGSGAGFAAFSLSCVSCHDPHGNGNYRILRSLPAATGGATDRTAAGTFVPDEPGTLRTYTTTNYFNNGPSGITGWCSQCHTRYYASSGSGHSVNGDAIFTYRHTTASLGANLTCERCHAPHGTNAVANGFAAGVQYPGGTEGVAPTGGSRLLKMDNRGICLKCHYR